MEIASIKLSEVFQAVKKPKYVLGTTYTLSLAFFESVVLPFIDRSELKSCLIISDALGYSRALAEGPALQGAGQSYMIVSAPTEGSFHAKVWLIVGEDEMILMAGSGNLTQSGFMVNSEIFDVLRFTREELPPTSITDEITSFLSGLASMWTPGDKSGQFCADVLDQIRRSVISFSSGMVDGASTVRFLHSFSGPLINALPDVKDCSALLVASPFFGGKLDGLSLMRSRYTDAPLHVFPAVHNKNCVDLPIDQLQTSLKPEIVAQLHIPGKARPLAHLKLYGIRGSSDSWLFCTSANCTVAAWRGPNIEAGILRKVDDSLLDVYFRADKAALPTGRLEYGTDGGNLITFKIYASDNGSGTDIVAETEQSKCPLTNVNLYFRAGSNLATCKKDRLFDGGTVAHIPMSDLKGSSGSSNMAICLELTGTDCAGNKVFGACFVENRMLLIADPIHRSAWRGALALLDGESMPDLSDISAIFTLVGNIFDGRFITITAHSKLDVQTNTYNADSEDDDLQVAIWPPQPVYNDLHKHIGTTGLGQLQWCQKILNTLLMRETDEDQKQHPHTEIANESDDKSDESHDPEAEEIQRHKLAERIWKKAESDYQRLANRLWTMEPNEKLASNTWTAAIFVFLATMAVRRAVCQFSSEFGSIPSASSLCNDFLRHMVEPRKQKDDFCCSKGMRYQREIFPPLSADLRDNFKQSPHPDLATIMLAVITQKKMKEAPNNEYPLLWPRLLAEVLDSRFIWNDAIAVATLRIWNHYLRDASDPHSEADFSASLQSLMTMRTK